MNEKLKPCPFCGAKAGYDGDYTVGCTDESCDAFSVCMTLEQWNNRPTEKAAREEMLEMALEIAVDERTANFAKILRQAYQERFGEQG